MIDKFFFAQVDIHFLNTIFLLFPRRGRRPFFSNDAFLDETINVKKNVNWEGEVALLSIDINLALNDRTEKDHCRVEVATGITASSATPRNNGNRGESSN